MMKLQLGLRAGRLPWGQLAHRTHSVLAPRLAQGGVELSALSRAFLHKCTQL